MSESPRTSRGDREMSASADFASALNFERGQASLREASLSLAAIDSNAAQELRGQAVRSFRRSGRTRSTSVSGDAGRQETRSASY